MFTHTKGYRSYLLRRIYASAFNRLNRLAANPITLKKSILGQVLPLNVQDTSQCFFYLGVPTEPENQALLAALGEELGGDFIDVGANYGQLAFHLFGKFRRTVLIEPGPEAASFIRSLFAKEPSVCIVEGGAGDANQLGTFRLGDEHQSGVSTITIGPNGAGPTIRITTIDEVVAETNIEPTVIKIDVEGSEECVLLGSTSTIARYKPVLAWEVRNGERFEACSRLTPNWRFYRIDSRLAHGVSILRQVPTIAQALVFGSKVQITEVNNVDGFVNLIFAVHPERHAAFLQSLDRLKYLGVSY